MALHLGKKMSVIWERFFLPANIDNGIHIHQELSFRDRLTPVSMTRGSAATPQGRAISIHSEKAVWQLQCAMTPGADNDTSVRLLMTGAAAGDPCRGSSPMEGGQPSPDRFP